MESRIQGPRPRPRTRKNFEAKAKDTKKFRGQGQGQTLSRPRTKDTDASILQKQKVLKIFFQAISKKRCSKFFSGEKGLKNFFFRRSLLEETKKRFLQIFRKVSGVFPRNFNGSIIVLSLSRGQGDFRGLEASRPGPRPRTSKCVLEDVLEAKDVLEDSTSGI